MTALDLERIFYLLYLLLGPAAWALFGFGMVKGRQRMDLFRERLEPLPDPPPKVSIIIPVKDEVQRIGECIASALQQQYPNFELIVVDDRSTDGTERIVDEMAATDRRLIALHIKTGDLPMGWFGKSFALHTAVPRASGEWFCFVDSDVVLQPTAVHDTIALAEYKRYDLVSFLPKLYSGGFWESLIIPLGGTATSAMYMLPFTNYNESKVAFANGQYLCIRRSVYDAVGGHAAVGGQMSEDVQLAKLVKGRGFRPRLSVGTRYAAVRMYNSPRAVFQGWARNFYAGSLGRPWRILAALSFVLLGCFSVYVAAGFGVYRLVHPLAGASGGGWIATATLHLGLMTAFLALMYHWSGNRWAYALLLPLGLGSIVVIFLRSLWFCITGKVVWRGTSYARNARRESVPTS